MDIPEHRRILVLYAHPASYRSTVNQSLFNAIRGLTGVTARDLYAEYPAFDIDVLREQRLLKQHDVIIFLCPFYWQEALCIGLIFSLSSTAIVLQTLHEKGLTNTPGGKNCFSVLLFQDIAVIPMLALIPLLAASSLTTPEESHGLSLVANLSGWSHALAVAGAIAVVVIAGHYLTRPLFRFILNSAVERYRAASDGGSFY